MATAGCATCWRPRGARVRVTDRSLDVEVDAEDPFIVIRDVLAETSLALRSLGAKQTTLEDIYLAEEEYSL